MLIFTEEQVKNAYDNSSEVMKSLLLEKWVIEDATFLGRKYKLRMDKVGNMNKLISYVMLNLLPMSRFAEYLKKELLLDDQTTLALTKDLDKNIFQKIKQEVLYYNSEKKKKTDVKSIFEEKQEIKEEKDLKGEVRDYGDILDSKKQKEGAGKKEDEDTLDPYRTFIDD
ncbi:hypothetical protein CSB11_01895 [Candidatus Campbellbacteria bacterium]|nr:MAG: hypothetical protein CSB11_01895 [Candidatus Campbellbacteria bacterium]